METTKPTYIMLTVTPELRDKLDAIVGRQLTKASRKGVCEAILSAAADNDMHRMARLIGSDNQVA